jgi:hypothetical protein
MATRRDHLEDPAGTGEDLVTPASAERKNDSMGINGYNEVANSRRTRLVAGWVPAHHPEQREYAVTEGPVANVRRSRAEEEPQAGPQV